MKELKLQLDPIHHISMTYSANLNQTQTLNLTRGQKFIIQQQLKQRQGSILRQRLKQLTRQKQQSKLRDKQIKFQANRPRSIIKLNKESEKEQKQTQKQFSLNVEKYQRMLENIQEQKQELEKEDKYYSYTNIQLIHQTQEKNGGHMPTNYRMLDQKTKNKPQDFSNNRLMLKNPITCYYNLPNIAYKKRTSSKRCLSEAQQRQSKHHSMLKNIQMSQIIGRNKNSFYTENGAKSKKFLDHKDKNKIQMNLKLRQKYIQIVQTTRSTKKIKIFNNNLIKQKLQKDEKDKQINTQSKIRPKLSIKSQPTEKYLKYLQYGLQISSKQPSYQYHCQFQDPDNPNPKKNDNRVFISNFCKRGKQASKLLNNRIKLMLGRRANRVANHSIWQKDNSGWQLGCEKQKKLQLKENDHEIQDHQILSPSSLKRQIKLDE